MRTLSGGEREDGQRNSKFEIRHQCNKKFEGDNGIATLTVDDAPLLEHLLDE